MPEFILFYWPVTGDMEVFLLVPLPPPPYSSPEPFEVMALYCKKPPTTAKLSKTDPLGHDMQNNLPQYSYTILGREKLSKS